MYYSSQINRESKKISGERIAEKECQHFNSSTQQERRKKEAKKTVGTKKGINNPVWSNNGKRLPYMCMCIIVCVCVCVCVSTRAPIYTLI